MTSIFCDGCKLAEELISIILKCLERIATVIIFIIVGCYIVQTNHIYILQC